MIELRFGAHFAGADVCLREASQLSPQTVHGFYFLSGFFFLSWHLATSVSFYLCTHFPARYKRRLFHLKEDIFPSVECWTVFLYLDEARSELDAHPSRNTPQKAWSLSLFLTRLTECWDFNIKGAMERLRNRNGLKKKKTLKWSHMAYHCVGMLECLQALTW